MIRVGPQLQRGDIESVETILQVAFPASYKSFLLKYNGGVPDPNSYYIPELEGGQWDSIDFFYTLRSTAKGGSVLRTTLSISDRLPADCIVIAAASGGDIVLGVVGPREGRVWYWDWYASKLDDPETRIYPIAASFNEFIDGLCDDPTESLPS